MDALLRLFVGQPLTLGVVAVAALLLWAVLRAQPGTRARAAGALWLAMAWLLYAAWEALVWIKSPEADIRVDLLLIWPVVGLASAWGIFRMLHPKFENTDNHG